MNMLGLEIELEKRRRDGALDEKNRQILDAVIESKKRYAELTTITAELAAAINKHGVTTADGAPNPLLAEYRYMVALELQFAKLLGLA
jgi:predicted amidohydrolase YtcJ